MTTNPKAISVNNLSIEIKTDDGVLPIVSGISFDIDKGETLALVGESGCGKSISSLALTKLLPTNTTMYPTGSILLNGTNLLEADASYLRSIRGKEITYVFQEPFNALNPLQKIGNQLVEGFLLHGLGSKEEDGKKSNLSIGTCWNHRRQTSTRSVPESVFWRYVTKSLYRYGSYV